MMTFIQQSRDAIRASGGRITTQREMLLDLLSQLEHDIDAEHLFQLASELDPNISLPTIYRTLHTLEDAQLIASHYVSSEHDRKVYRINDRTDAFHFACRRCGRVTPFQSELIEQIKDELRDQLGADVMSLCMCASGICADCREKEQTMTLDGLRTGESATIRTINGKGAVRRRLMDMGLSKGVRIEMVKAAPMGDPIEYMVRGYHLSLRKSEAELVEIVPLGSDVDR
ncbi:MAG: transcriptional repressor [Anaerolineae bacterium]|nr:transcriptional repressor [Anaerolineae bacterium]